MEWKVQRNCRAEESAKERRLIVYSLFDGTETVLACPDYSKPENCKVGKVTHPRYWLEMDCLSERTQSEWGQWSCRGIWLDVRKFENHELDLYTTQRVQPEVKQFDLAGGMVRLGPLYGGVDMVITGMTPISDPTTVYGGAIAVVGVAGAMVTSKIDMHATCSDTIKH